MAGQAELQCEAPTGVLPRTAAVIPMSRAGGAPDPFADAMALLAAAAQRPVSAVRVGDSDVVRVDFEFGRYCLARNDEAGLCADPDAIGSWTVTFHDVEGGPARVLAEATDEWLADAFDLAFDALGAAVAAQSPLQAVVEG
ncbi:hypothetical protein C8K36_103110 [Rhodococcus sp. OK519]|uniref:hypothetical protein n=1 Tax=Rhodococcus sp. OK519 TaxID=2135729 RepID=UPI000D3AE17F|nr:hypothetical protein C8K36_103110 [Rhodococcus sp. OK519]